MKRLILTFAIVFTYLIPAIAQPPGGGQGPPGGRQGPPGGPPRDFRAPPGFHLMTALDTDKNGKISAKEMAGAAAALQKLDKNQDGKLSATEIGWPPAGGFGGGKGRGGFPGFGGRGNDQPRRPEAEPPATDSRPSSTNSSRKFFSVAQLKSLDRNDDGKITTDEIPKGLRERILGRVDTNKDGVIEKAELTKAGESSNK